METDSTAAAAPTQPITLVERTSGGEREGRGSKKIGKRPAKRWGGEGGKAAIRTGSAKKECWNASAEARSATWGWCSLYQTLTLINKLDTNELEEPKRAYAKWTTSED